MTTSAASGNYSQGVYPVIIDGSRVRLRDFQDDDLDGCMTIVGDPGVTWYLSFDARTREQQDALLRADIARAKGDQRSDYYLAAVERSTNTLIGFVRLGFDRPRTAELGYALRRDRWGKGYATEIAALMLHYGYSVLNLHRVQAACGPDNVASQRVLAKLGFAYEGRMREHVFTNGAWRDSLLYSLLKHEWTAMPNVLGGIQKPTPGP
jgi:ribosomal-protein-alanine N-acetyltransferase